MKISTKSQYGLRAMICLAGSPKKVFSLKTISEKEGISFDYLEKIMSKLEKAGLVRSKKGIQGGYCLAKPPLKISAGEIITALEGPMALVKCISKEKDEKYDCPRKRICKSLIVWKKIQDVLNSTLNSISLTDLLEQ